jgi:hypothetical protein
VMGGGRMPGATGRNRGALPRLRGRPVGARGHSLPKSTSLRLTFSRAKNRQPRLARSAGSRPCRPRKRGSLHQGHRLKRIQGVFYRFDRFSALMH